MVIGMEICCGRSQVCCSQDVCVCSSMENFRLISVEWWRVNLPEKMKSSELMNILS